MKFLGAKYPCLLLALTLTRTKVTMGLMAGHVVPELVGPDEAQKELATLSYTGGAKGD